MRDHAAAGAEQGRSPVRVLIDVRVGARRAGGVPAGSAGPVRADQGRPDGPDERYLFLSDILPTAWQSVVYADPPEGGTLAVFGLGPVGQFAARIGKHWGRRVIGVDVVPERREMAARHGVEVLDPSGLESGADIADALRDLTGGRGPDAVVDAVGMEAHGSHVARAAQNLAGLLPDAAARKVFEKVGVDGLTVLHAALDAVAGAAPCPWWGFTAARWIRCR